MIRRTRVSKFIRTTGLINIFVNFGRILVIIIIILMPKRIPLDLRFIFLKRQRWGSSYFTDARRGKGSRNKAMTRYSGSIGMSVSKGV